MQTISLDPSPETNDTLVHAGSRRAAELALGPPAGWARLISGHVMVPVLLVAPWLGGPSSIGVLFGVTWCVAAAWMIGRASPRVLGHVRRIPLAILSVAAGGLGACVGFVGACAMLLASPSLHDADRWALAAASFGLAYASLSFVPLLLAGLGRMPRWSLAVFQAIATPLAFVFALLNAASI